MTKTVLIAGLGEVSQWALELLTRRQGVDRIVTADLREDFGIYRTNAAAVSAVLEGYDKKLEFRKLDIRDVDGTAKLLEDVKPDVVLAGLTLQSPRVLRTAPLPAHVSQRLHLAGFAVWLPWHLVLMSKLTEAVIKSGIETHVVNASFPDAVGPILRRYHGHAPTVGLGNHDILVGEIIRRVSDAERVPIEDVNLFFVGSHALVDQGSKIGVPFFLKVLVGDRDVTAHYDIKSWTEDLLTGFRSPVGRQSQMYSFVAASGVKNIMAILNDTNEFTHSPSPNGLPGGYPMRLSAKGATVVLPQELTLAQAIAINDEAAKWDGIARIEDDGTVVFTDQTYGIMKEFGYDCRALAFDDLEPRAEELRGLYTRLG